MNEAKYREAERRLWQSVGRTPTEQQVALPRIGATPTHFVWGEDDTFGGAEVANWVVEAMPNATLEMRPDSGHLPWLDAPASVAAATQAFLLDV